MQDYFGSIPNGRPLAVGTSLVIWLMHFIQIWFFILALGLKVPFDVNMALTPLAIFIGLLPMTLAGIGTCDAAPIYFYLPYFSAAGSTALGLLCTLRYPIPALIVVSIIFNLTHGADFKKELRYYGRDLGHG